MQPPAFMSLGSQRLGRPADWQTTSGNCANCGNSRRLARIAPQHRPDADWRITSGNCGNCGNPCDASGLRRIGNAEPVLAGDLAHVRGRCDAAEGRDDLGIAAGIAWHAAAAAGHVETDRDMVGADRLDDVVDLLRPFVGGRQERLGLGILLPAAAGPPTLRFARQLRSRCLDRHFGDAGGHDGGLRLRAAHHDAITDCKL